MQVAIGDRAFSFPEDLPFVGSALDTKRNSASKTTCTTITLPFKIPFLATDGSDTEGKSVVGAENQDKVLRASSAHALANGEHIAPGGHYDPTLNIAAANAQMITQQMQLKQQALENVLSDQIVEMVHLREQLAKEKEKLLVAHEHIEHLALREAVMEQALQTIESCLVQVQLEFEEKLDIQELVSYRSYAQKCQKEVKSTLSELADFNHQQDVIIKQQASEIAWLKNELELQKADLEVALEDLKSASGREWKKHRAVCMEIGGVYIDFNHREHVGITMDRSSKYGPKTFGMLGVGLKLGNIFPFEVLAVHPDSRTTDGLPALFQEGDKIVAINEINCEFLTRSDINGLILGPAETSVSIKILRGTQSSIYMPKKCVLSPKNVNAPHIHTF